MGAGMGRCRRFLCVIRPERLTLKYAAGGENAEEAKGKVRGKEEGFH
jgi:hypothetical protein